MYSRFNPFKFILGTAIVFIGVGCKSTSSESSSGSSSGVALSSSAYGSNLATRTSIPMKVFELFFIPSARASVSSISGFKFCITKMKFDGENDEAISSGGSSEFEAKLGLIDLGDGSQPTSWGRFNPPEGSVIKRIKVEIHKDKDLCGVDYSAALTDSDGNVHSISKDIELKFKFASPKALQVGDEVTVSLSSLVNIYGSALSASQFDDEHIGHYMEEYENGSEDSAE